MHITNEREREREREREGGGREAMSTCELIHSNRFLFDMEASSIECRRQGKTGILERRSSEDATLKQIKHFITVKIMPGTCTCSI